MKILMINSVCGIGSTGRICTDLAGVLEKQGHTVKIAYGRQAAPPQFAKYGVRIGSDIGVRLNGICSRLIDNEGFNAYFATKKFIRWVEEYDPDVIHLHNLHGYYLNLPLLFRYLKRTQKRIVWTLHDCWAFTGHCAHYAAAGCDRWRTRCHHCPQKKEYPRSALLDRSAANFIKKRSLFTGLQNLTIVTPSYWLAEQVKNSYLKEYEVKPIYNGIDLSVFKPTESDFAAQHKLEGKKIILGVATAWNEKKGLLDFMRLAKILPDAYRIVLVGLSQKQIAQLPPEVLGLSRTENLQQLVQIYSAADVFVNPSVEETMGLTTAEALACGTPAITYNRTAVPEVADETCGVAVDCSPERIVNALGQLCASVEDCVKRARFFDKNEKWNEYLRLYEQV